MNPKLLLVIGLGVGYVLGTRAGRERYDQLKATAVSLWENPRVVKARNEVEHYARQQAPIIRERAEAAAKAAPGAIADAAREVADKTVGAAKTVGALAGDVADDIRSQALKTAHELRERGEDAVERAVTAVGLAREQALDTGLFDSLSDGLSDDVAAGLDDDVSTAPTAPR